MTKRLARPQRRRLRVLLLAVALLAVLALLFWREQNAIQTEVIYVAGAPAAFKDFSIALISDLHGKEFGPGNEKLLAATAALEPDIIAVTGDLIHDEAQLVMVPALARGLAAIAPTYYVTGNHEWAAGCAPELKSLLTECGVTVLSNEYTLFECAGEKLALLGIDDPNGPEGQTDLAALSAKLRWEEGEDCYQLLLAHRNNRYPVYEAATMDLTLSGHGHGGLIRLPFTDGLVGPLHEFFPTHTAGRYDLAFGQMVVSRGLGNQFPLFRLFNRPHLPLIVLTVDEYKHTP